MINCSIHNYKEWIGAYIDGNLSNADMRSAEIFLQQHPHILDSYLMELEEFSLIPENIELVGKDRFQLAIQPTSHIHSNNFTEYFIGNCEGLLSDAEQTELNSFLHLNPKLKKEAQIYELTKLSVDNSIQYPFKKNLLKQKKPAVRLFWPISAAASILLVLGIWFLWPSSATNGMAFQPSSNFKTKSINTNSPVHIIDNNSQLVNNTVFNKNQSVIKNKTKHSPFEQQRSRHVEELIGANEIQTAFVSEIMYMTNENATSLAFIQVPEVDYKAPILDENLADAKPKKKGLLSKILSDEPVYIEDYVNATFTAFNDNKEVEKWALKVERDENGKSKKVKFTSPLFSTKNNH